MHIINVMFSKGLGGIEQSLVDYCEALKIAGYKVTAIISPHAEIKFSLLSLGINIIEVKNFSSYDIFARAYIRKIMRQLQPDAVIMHGNRAVSLVRGAYDCAMVGVTHNYSIKRLIGLDAVLATTADLAKKLKEAGQPMGRIFSLPNMVRIYGNNIAKVAGKPTQNSSFHTPIVIGTMGRFVKKKGFDVFIRAAGHLQAQGLDFTAVIGGSGEEEENLKKLAEEIGLLSSHRVLFPGWIGDKEQFFSGIDIFVLPSLHEPFGIILLEAMAHKKPVISTDSEGPSEIITNGVDAVIVPKGDSKAMADAIIHLAGDHAFANMLAENGFAKAECYDIKHFASSLGEAIIKIKSL